MIIKHNRQFNLLPAHAGLKNYILYYNLVFPAGDTFTEQYTLMPNACGTLSLAFDGTSVIAELWGASMAPVLLGTEPDRYRVLLLIQFSPYGLYQITRQSQAEFAGKRLLLEDIDSRLFHSLQQAFVQSKTVSELVQFCDDILYKRMEQPVISSALLVAAAVISDSRGQVKVKEASRQSGYSERQLNRLFLTQIGLTMKSYARLIRFHYVLKHLKTSSCYFATLSQQAGYFDQAHLDKDFKAISGVSPQAFRKSMSDFYYEEAEIYHTIFSKEE